MKKNGFYIMKNKFFEDMSDPYLKGNKSGNHLMLTSEHLARKIEHKARKIIGMLKRGIKFTPTQPDVMLIYRKLCDKD